MKLDSALEAVKKELSLPTRGAWIEISRNLTRLEYPPVAPHTGSVD